MNWLSICIICQQSDLWLLLNWSSCIRSVRNCMDNVEDKRHIFDIFLVLSQKFLGSSHHMQILVQEH